MPVEMGGMPVTAGLMSKDPFKPDRCRFDDNKCLVDQDKDCMTQNSVYRITCQEPECLDRTDRKNIYLGQTGRSLHARALDHRTGLARHDPKCPLTKHSDDYHANSQDMPQFKMEPVRTCKGNIQRLLTESQWISKYDPDRIMNSKLEYSRNKMIRYNPVVTRV